MTGRREKKGMNKQRREKETDEDPRRTSVDIDYAEGEK